MPDLRLGALCWNQYTDWPSLLEAGVRAERLGYDTLWTWDHLYPIVGSCDGPILEGWLTLAAWAQATEPDPDRADGRREHVPRADADREDGDDARPHQPRPGDARDRRRLVRGGARGLRPRVRRPASRSGCAGSPRRCRSCAGCSTASGRPPAAPHYHARDVRNDPPPIQARLPLLIGGGGEQVTLKLVAEYGDANNVGGGIERVRHKEEVLLRHCETVGRDPAEIERTTGLGVVVIRDSREEARKVAEAIFARQRPGAAVGEPAGRHARGRHRVPGALPRDRLPPPVAGFPSPYDEESMTRLATEVRPALAG